MTQPNEYHSVSDGQECLLTLLLFFSLSAAIFSDKAFGGAISPIRQSIQQSRDMGSEAGDETERDRALNEAHRLFKTYRKLQGEGKYDEALPLIERALGIREKILGPDHPDVAAALHGLAIVCYRKGEYVKALQFCRRALAIRERVLGTGHPDVARSLNLLAILQDERGEEAEYLYRRALAILEKAEGGEHQLFAIIINNLAVIPYSRGDYAEAERLYLRALTIGEKALGPEHIDLVFSLNNLANLYRDRGDDVKAEPLFQRGLSIREKALGPEHPDVADSLTSFAHLYRDRGYYAEAEAMYRRGLGIREKALGPEHVDIADSLANLALLYTRRGEYDRAEPLYRKALAIRERVLGAEDHRVAHLLNDLALLYTKRGEYTKAEPLYTRGLALLERAKGPEHPDVAISLSQIARFYRAKGDLARAIEFQARANAAGERNLALNLATGSQRQKLAYLALFSKETDFTLSLHSQLAPDNPQAFDMAFTTLLRRKGRGLDAMTDTIATLRRRARPQDRMLFDRLTEARSQLAAVTLRGPGAAQADNYREKRTSLEEEVEKLEAELSSRSAEFRTQLQPVTLAAVQVALPPGSALVEFAVCTPRDPRTEKSEPPRYLVYLLPAQGPPRWADLGDAASIDRAVAAWRGVLRDPYSEDVKKLARTVDEKVMRPVRSLLGEVHGGTRRLLIAPDGLLNLIPFAALVDERNRYLVERYTISHLTSGRDLLRLQRSQPSKNAPLIVANPIFGWVETITAPADQKSGDSQAGDQVWGQIDPTTVFFQSLPGTQREALAIKAVLPRASVLLREEATETAIKRSKAPRVLHIATHGFFLDDQEAPPVEMAGVPGDGPLRLPVQLSKWAGRIENPLLRSGLALAGVNEHRSGDDDGVLTALEAASLDLWGTRLVVLSGCDTGVGEVKNGEGVYGLRRALVLAGSETQVLSLWPVLDNRTVSLMTGYYGRLMKGEGRGEALRQIQLQMLKDVKLRHPHYWGNFIQAGEWANLDGQR
jgi:CHAT domain-containing protein/tetratricopeptide (TPR) repeat protein